jgi:hypothetical protein
VNTERKLRTTCDQLRSGRKRFVIGAICLVLMFSLWVYGHLEAYCHFYPAIDTRFAAGFSEKAFSQISTGMSVSDVQSRVGKPLLTFINGDGLEEWLFTDDGKCWWGDFAWLRRSLAISNSTVVSIDRSIHYD